jgi:hypothetical protein
MSRRRSLVITYAGVVAIALIISFLLADDAGDSGRSALDYFIVAFVATAASMGIALIAHMIYARRPVKPKYRSLAFVMIALVVTICVRVFEPDNRYTFGHPEWVDWSVWSQLWLLAATHLCIAIIMWVQANNWLPSEEAMFDFIGVKAVFWGNIASSYAFRGIGIRLDIAALYIFMLIATALLDWRMIERYVLGHEDERSADWDGEEHRSGSTSRRTDLSS